MTTTGLHMVRHVRVKDPKAPACSKHVKLYDPRAPPDNAHYIETCSEPYSCERLHMTWGEFKEDEYEWDGH